MKAKQRLGVALLRVAHGGIPAAAAVNHLAPRNRMVGVHFAASTPNFAILEYRDPSPGPLRDLVLEPMKLKDGYLEIPDAPGLGIELNLETVRKFPPKPWRRPPAFQADGAVGFI